MTTPVAPRRLAGPYATACRLVDALGGRFSRELEIDVDAGARGVDEWFLAATLFGTRISAATAMRTYRVLAGAGVRTVTDAASRSWDDLVALLDSGGYARYDFRTATRVQQLGAAVREQLGGSLASLASVPDPQAVERALDALPGWGPTTVRIFLRELRGVWPGAQPPLDARVMDAARHLRIPIPEHGPAQVEKLRDVAARARLDPRDLEAALVRMTLGHRDLHSCPGGGRCVALRRHAQDSPAH